MRALVIVLCLAGAASANPVSRDELKGAAASLSEQLEEPVGLLVTTHLPKLGLLKGDVLVALNGVRVIHPSDLASTIGHAVSLVHLDVVRAGKPITVRLALQPAALEVTQDRKKLGELLALRSGTGIGIKAVTKNGVPAGVVLSTDWFGTNGPLRGDLLRKVDGKPVTTVDQAFKAIEASLAKPKIVLDLERNARAFSVTVQLVTDPADDPELDALVDKIEQLSETSYKVPKKLFEKAAANPMVFANGARTVPFMKNGKPEGIKLYAIRPSSLFAKLGFMNGDTLVSVNGVAVAVDAKAVDAFGKLGTAKRFELELIRRGKPVTLEWTVK